MARKTLRGEELTEEEQLEAVELAWHIAVQAMINGGHTREEAEAALESVELGPEWLQKIRDAVGLG